MRQLATGYRRRHGACTVVSAGLSAEAPAAALTCLIGSNGAGKSTLIRTLAGLQPPLGGTLDVGGIDTVRATPRQRARTVAVVLTDRLPTGLMTARDVVAMGRTPHTGFWGRGDKADADAVSQALAMAGIAGKAGQRLTQMSDGERQKVMIAKALAQATPVMVLDEPTAFLDYPSRALTMRLLARLAHEQRKTIVVSTHDLELALHTADHLWMLTPQGMEQGTPHQLAAGSTLPAFLAAAGMAVDSQTLGISPVPAPHAGRERE